MDGTLRVPVTPWQNGHKRNINDVELHTIQRYITDVSLPLAVQFHHHVGTYCCILLIDPTKNLIKDNKRTSMNKQITLLYKNISLSFYSWKGNTVCCKFEREMERHILREGTSSCPLSFSGPGGANACRNASDRLRVPRSRFRLDWLNLTVWSSYHLVSFQLHTCSTGLPWRTAIHLFTNHNVTACQSTRDHQERTQNLCQQSLYNNI